MARDQTIYLLEKMKNRNSRDPNHGTQILGASEPLLEISTFADSFVRPLSPMLRSRFQFCGSWKNARLSQNWLSLTEIRDAKNNETLSKWVALRTENSYDNDPPGCVAAENCAVFSYNPYEPEETYLVWEDGKEEPLVWEYFGWDYLRFENLNHYLEYIVGDRTVDDSGRIQAEP
ncbi:hypothetical protein [Parazoarcus communis]|uniref:SMI1/KNR4 family protein n=1 Tax=Parazoarcus communis SWub3 = DSM 12120 TaxID=1121029 RepID=A0A323USI4_9RHOO|nr:hypothetical protein [Parazoarcus communis]NMG72731.1 hypothetical protein [Parazoarcus communis SWub3 = DSM 12120]PZA15449.1 hypothetical protein DNK49_17090 [Azoarcus communis] [Parazoarcus communis SWub3 = DSM 12120]